MKKKLYQKYKKECGKIAISIEGDYTIIVDNELNKDRYHIKQYDVHTHSKNGIITVYVYVA